MILKKRTLELKPGSVLRKAQKKVEILLSQCVNIPSDFNIATSGISQSKLSKFMNCELEFILDLNRWEKPGRENSTFFGNTIHDHLESMYTMGEAPTRNETENWLEDYFDSKRGEGTLSWISPSVLEEQTILFIETLSAYWELYGESDFKTMKFIDLEQKWELNHHGILLMGKKDGLFTQNRKRYLMEHKTKTRIDPIAIQKKLEMDFQVMIYLLAERKGSGKKIENVLYNIIRRGKQYKGKKESMKAFATRIRNEIMKNPSEWFIRFDVQISEEQFQMFKKDLDLILQRVESLVTGKRPPIRNLFVCHDDWGFPCDFIDACSTGKMDGYTQRASLHPEL